MRVLLTSITIVGLLFVGCSKKGVNKGVLAVSKDISTPWGDLGEYVKPVIMVGKGTYCSSSHISYRGKVFAVTNRHCCDVDQPVGIPKDYLLLGDTLLKKLYVSEDADLCVLRSNKFKGLPLAKKEPSKYDKNVVIGYPLGFPQTMRMGHFQYNENVCLQYGNFFEPDVRCVDSYINSTVIRPGNSGSPSFNRNGEVVGIIYAGSDIDSVSTTLPQLKEALQQAYSGKSK